MGRKKKDISYFDRTQPFAVRVDKDIMAKFLEAFHNERTFHRAAGKSFFLKNLVEDMLKAYAETTVTSKPGAEALKDIAEVKSNLASLHQEVKDAYKKILAMQDNLNGKDE